MKKDPLIVKLLVTDRTKRGKLMAQYKLMGVDAEGKRHYLKFINEETVCELFMHGGSTVEWDITSNK